MIIISLFLPSNFRSQFDGSMHLFDISIFHPVICESNLDIYPSEFFILLKFKEHKKCIREFENL